MHISKRSGHDPQIAVAGLLTGASDRNENSETAEQQYGELFFHQVDSGLRDGVLRLHAVRYDKNGAEGGTRTPMGCPTRPSNVRVYQFHHFGTCEKTDLIYFIAGCFAA